MLGVGVQHGFVACKKKKYNNTSSSALPWKLGKDTTWILEKYKRETLEKNAITSKTMQSFTISVFPINAFNSSKPQREETSNCIVRTSYSGKKNCCLVKWFWVEEQNEEVYFCLNLQNFIENTHKNVAFPCSRLDWKRVLKGVKLCIFIDDHFSLAKLATENRHYRHYNFPPHLIMLKLDITGIRLPSNDNALPPPPPGWRAQ